MDKDDECDQFPDCPDASDEHVDKCEPKYGDRYCPEFLFECAETKVR